MTQDERKVIELALKALITAEAGLADIGDADREPTDDLAWCEERAAQALAKPRAAITAIKEALAQPETPYEIGQRIAKTGGGIYHIIVRGKFAELIVRECAVYCEGHILPKGMAEENDLNYNDGVMDCAIGLKQHFGVEE